jgi:DNA-binding transcriptional LysR family regulator
MDVHLRDLRYFVTVAEECHFTRAAERLFVSQPALSKQIRQLERDLRATLFNRDRRAVTLTAAGAALLPAAQGMLRDWDEAQHFLAEAVATEHAVLTVGLQTAVGRGLFDAVSSRFAETRPGWKLRLRQIAWDDPTAGLADSSSDAAIVWLPLPDPEPFSTRVLFTEPRHVALPARHRLAVSPVIDFAQLTDEPFLALPAEAGALRDYWLATAERDGRPARIGGEIAGADETFEAVANGLGVVLLSAGNAEIYRRDGIVTVPVSGLPPSQLAVIWRQGDHRGALRSFVEACLAATDGHDRAT